MTVPVKRQGMSEGKGHVMTPLPDTPPALDALAVALGHRFSDPSLLADAVTHPSLMGLERAGRQNQPGAPGAGYERLEFLGDRVVGLLIAEWLLERFPREKEGALAKRHAALVRRETLEQVALSIGLGAYLRLSPSEAAGGGRTNATILADACEAVIGALYLDGGMAAAYRFVRDRWADRIDRSASPPSDPKTILQEWAQGKGKPLPTYAMVECRGPAHAPEFHLTVTVEGVGTADGAGPNKRIAEKNAARALLRLVGVVVDE